MQNDASPGEGSYRFLWSRFGPMYWEVPELLKDLATSGRRFADL